MSIFKKLSKTPNWPKGYPRFYATLAKYKDVILTEKVVSIDPASHSMGIAFYNEGVMVSKGTIKGGSGKAEKRLRKIADKLMEYDRDHKVLLIEDIRPGRGFAPKELLWSVSAAFLAMYTPIIIHVPISFWKALAKITPTYTKTDANDAAIIGQAVIDFCKGLDDND